MILFEGLKSVHPELSREEDSFLSTIGIFYAGILAVHGWRLDPILQFSQALIVFTALSSIWQEIRLRAISLKLKKKVDTFLDDSENFNYYKLYNNYTLDSDPDRD